MDLETGQGRARHKGGKGMYKNAVIRDECSKGMGSGVDRAKQGRSKGERGMCIKVLS